MNTRAAGAEPATEGLGPVGLIGLGLVGTALGSRLRHAGFTVLGFDRSAAARDAWAAGGGKLAASVAAIALACRCVVLAVYDTAGVIEVVEGEAGLLGAWGAMADTGTGTEDTALEIPDVGTTTTTTTHTLFDTSTGDPDALQALAARLATRGVGFIEAPLSGSSRQIADGAATMLLGGETHTIARHATLLETLSPRRIVVGGTGMGARAKLATNLVLGLNRAALAEGLVFAERLGIAPETFLQLVLATPARSDAALAKGRRMVESDFAAPQSRVHQHLKDLQLMLAAAAAAGGQRLPFTETHAAVLQAAVQAGDGELDNAAIVQQLRRARLAD